MVEAIVRHWKRELVPLRHLKYLTTGSSEADHEDENWMRRKKLLHEPDALPAELVPDDDDPPEQPEEANPLAEARSMDGSASTLSSCCWTSKQSQPSTSVQRCWTPGMEDSHGQELCL